MCPQIFVNSKCNHIVARKSPYSRTRWCSQINLWNAKNTPSLDELIFFWIVYLKREKKMHMYFFFFNLLQRTLIVLLSVFLVALLNCSHCWSAWHWGQKSNVLWSRGSIMAVSLWAGSLPKVLIQVTLKSSLEVVKKGNCKCVAHKITFICFEVYLLKVFHSTVLYC